MPYTFWARNIAPKEPYHLLPSRDLHITNVALSCESSEFGRTSLTLSRTSNTTQMSPLFTVGTFILGRIEQLSIHLHLIKGETYVLQVHGQNSMSLLGFEGKHELWDSHIRKSTDVFAEEPDVDPSFIQAVSCAENLEKSSVSSAERGVDSSPVFSLDETPMHQDLVTRKHPIPSQSESRLFTSVALDHDSQSTGWSAGDNSPTDTLATRCAMPMVHDLHDNKSPILDMAVGATGRPDSSFSTCNMPAFPAMTPSPKVQKPAGLSLPAENAPVAHVHDELSSTPVCAVDAQPAAISRIQTADKSPNLDMAMGATGRPDSSFSTCNMTPSLEVQKPAGLSLPAENAPVVHVHDDLSSTPVCAVDAQPAAISRIQTAQPAAALRIHTADDATSQTSGPTFKFGASRSPLHTPISQDQKTRKKKPVPRNRKGTSSGLPQIPASDATTQGGSG
ncbi:hypothetical protein FB446DRAFT_789167 [Lentinula raphanica]|nr:hypothetical protein FB446DRAFT_789167 [Lentinula raphanica]